MLTVKDVAWAAGFLEGEGSFQSSRTTPTVVCSQVQREPLERLLRMFGGNIIPLKHKEGTRGQPYFRWYISGVRAAEVAMTLLVLMSPRRFEQIVKMLDIWKARKPRTWHNASKTHCKRGHEFTPENTYAKGGKYRECRTCSRESKRMYELTHQGA